MAQRFEVTMLPASEGDGLLLVYGPDHEPKRVLIDLGRKSTYPHLKALLPDESDRRLELFVVSHVDRDHIEGAIDLLEDEEAGFTFGDIWFNGYHHLEYDPGLEDFGAVQGERLTQAIIDRGLPWNRAFEGAPARLGEDDSPVEHVLPGGLKLILLSPSQAKLETLAPKWEKECRKAGLMPGVAPTPSARSRRFDEFGGTDLAEMAARRTPRDRAAPNGSSIAFVAEYAGKRVLFAADAHPDLLVSSLRAYGGGAPVGLDLMKVSHHGSRANTTNALMKLVRCRRFLVSTNGSYFEHPDEEALARLVVNQPGPVTIYFNYEQDRSQTFADLAVGQERHPYSCHFWPDPARPATVAV